MRDSVRGDVSGILRALAIMVGLSLAAAGYAAGTIQWRLRDLLGAPHPKSGW